MIDIIMEKEELFVKLSLNRNQLKYIAILAMLIDHVAWCITSTTTPLGFVMHVIGRLTGPIMAFMLAEGYLHTRSIKKYGIRLFVFTLISWVPYSLFEARTWPAPTFGVIYTLFLGLIALWVWDKTNLKVAWKVVIIVLLCAISIFGDWPIFDILWPLFFVIYRDDPKKKWTAFTIIAISEVLLIQLTVISSYHPFAQVFQIGVFLVIPLLRAYNGKPGSLDPFHKWFFYVFYPLHLLILAFLFRL